MFPIQIDARLQILAGVSLLHASRLIRWSDEDLRFEPLDRDTFESTAFSDLDPYFGRLMRWMLFASGAEFLGKAFAWRRASICGRRRRPRIIRPRN